MALAFASAGSGSRGNATLIRNGKTTVLVDCGFSLSEMRRRLARLQVEPETLAAILVTHEHSDHISGVGRLAARWDLPVFASRGTLNAPGSRGLPKTVRALNDDRPFAIGDLEVTPLIVPHDAAEPRQFLFGDGVRRLAVLTDLGHVTPYLAEKLCGVEGLLLECNHDASLLAGGPYPAALKKRVGGDWGHLSNAQAAALLSHCDFSGLRSIALAHLSEQNNRPELAQASVADALGCRPEEIQVADQESGLAWQGLEAP